LFLISINFNPKKIWKFLRKIFNYFIRNNSKSYTDKSEIISEYIPQDEIKNLIQEDLPFIKAEKIKENEKLKFKLPALNLLKLPTQKERGNFEKNQTHEPEFLEKILLDFGVNGNIKKVSHGPVVTLNEFEPAAGIKVSKIINLSDDIARNTSSESARIATIPGSNTIGIELPNSSRENVYLSEILSNGDFKKKEIKLPIALGKNISGVPMIGDLASMPHLLIAGTTGSGKSVCINTIILSLLYRHGPEKCKFILIDPKMLELSTYEGIPHLLCPVITEAKKAASVLGWVVKEMESRYRLMTKEGVRNIDGYNTKHKLPMPYIVVVVDEMSDLMLVAGKEIENYIQKLSQMARAAGIHIIMATQRPSVDVITGTIKANFPTRISFQVTSKIDSRTILGEQGAEQLLGKGDMLYMSSANKVLRIHAPFVSDNEIEKINNFLRLQAEPDYVDEILDFVDEKEIGDIPKSSSDKDDLYQTALEIIKSEGKASTSFLQRKLQIGYNRAARIIDMMEDEGIVSKANHVGKRDVL
jgi:S-DNA-T family DNA segregation ATPase FtsK/SpoIIIE